ncbi:MULTISPECIES: site-specific integrase [Priestia]|uniref:site-specific integrase n=1 Tax=Priestia TaxID=2800373 RepID=UPI001C8EA7C1|nr:site-specific integrase [Priestia aryabhattai]MBY0213840.1 site-specific integrase [Priestia aryabhattai]
MGSILNKYKFVSRETNIKEFYNGRTIYKRTVIIGVLNEETEIIYPHPVTDFIKSTYEYSGKSINSQKIPAQVICRFLNFLYENIEKGNSEFQDLKEKGIKGLRLLHGSRYITKLSLEGKQKTTVKQYEKYLNRFYIYLSDKKLLEEYIDKEIFKSKTSGKTSYNSIFKHPSLPTHYPSRETINYKLAKLKDFGAPRIKLTKHFIEIARQVAPEIALGLCFEFYGGIRRGEVINLTRASLNIRYRESFEVQIKDNKKLLFARLRDTTFENPKRLNYLNLEMARQTILDNDLVWEVYDDHMHTLSILEKRGKIRNPYALFIDQYGNPMSGKVYEKRFNKVKKVFLDSLLGTAEHKLFDNTAWGTHIGRGVFTNILVSMGFTATQLAIARGDRNINSAMSYIDENLSQEEIKKAVNKFKTYPIESLGQFDVTELRKILKQKEGINGY